MTWLAAHIALMITTALALLATSVLLRQQRAPQATMAWLLAIVLVPYVGLPLYLALGVRKESQRSIAFPDHPTAVPLSDALAHDRQLRDEGLPPAVTGNTVRLLTTGEAAYDGLIDLVTNAERSIWMEVFILGDDVTGRGFLDAMTERARNGLDVRLLLDAVGSRPLPKQRLQPLRDAGGHVAYFEPLLHTPLRGRSNLRNHRKIAVADEARAFAGGMNVAVEYMGPTPHAGRWHDLAFRLDGPAVGDFTAVFRSDWAWSSREPLPDASALPETTGSTTAQVVPSGPDVPTDALFDLVLGLVYGATESVWLVTPYFVPDDAFTRALAAAARRGVDVRLVTPDPSNHHIADLARGPALRQLEAAGVRILRYTHGMIHAKSLVADGVALVGSANFDPRSLFLNAEAALVLTEAADVSTLASWIEALGKASVEGTGAVTPGRARLEGLAGLVSPLV